MSQGEVQPTIGRTVIYKITAEQAEQINRRRTRPSEIADRIKNNGIGNPYLATWPIGTQAHIGNTATAGDEYPLIIVRVWPHEFGEGIPGVNGQVILDGTDTLWVTSARKGNDTGEWHWRAQKWSTQIWARNS